MTTATVRDLRTQFPRVRKLLEQHGEVIVTHRGRPVIVLRPFEEPPAGPSRAIDYYRRLKRRMPTPLTTAQLRVLDDADRDER